MLILPKKKQFSRTDKHRTKELFIGKENAQ